MPIKVFNRRIWEFLHHNNKRVAKTSAVHRKATERRFFGVLDSHFSFRAELKKGKRMWDGRRENVYINIRLRGTRDKSLDKVPDAAPTTRKFRRALSEETECFEMLGERKRADARERKQKQRNMRAWDEIERVGIFNLLRQKMFAKKK